MRLLTRPMKRQFARDRVLRLDWRADEKVLQLFNLARRNAGESDLIRRLLPELVIADVSFQHSTSAAVSEWISYSRSDHRYSGMARYYGESFTRKNFVAAIDRLLEAGLILEERTAPSPTARRQSTVRASGTLLEVLLEEGVGVEFVPGETVRLKAGDPPRFVPYRDDFGTVTMRRQMAIINESIGSQHIEQPGAYRAGPLLIRRNDSGGETKPIPARTQLYRIFNRGSWRSHGRLYGHWIQLLPEAERCEVRIGREPVKELDFVAMHPQLLHAMEGLPFPDDPYRLPGCTRDEVKDAFLIGLNADSERSAIAALANKWSGEHMGGEDDESTVPADGSASEAGGQNLKALRDRARFVLDATQRSTLLHKAFFTGIGLKLMRKDSDLLVAILIAAAREGIVALPIHDSLVVQERHAIHLREIVNRQFSTHFRKAITPCRLKEN